MPRPQDTIQQWLREKLRTHFGEVSHEPLPERRHGIVTRMGGNRLRVPVSELEPGAAPAAGAHKLATLLRLFQRNIA